MTESRLLILGLGNPILGDDGVGWRVTERVKERLAKHQLEMDGVEVDCLSVGGISLMERLIGYERAILIDALVTGENPVGTVSVMPFHDLPNRALGHLSSSHDTTLQNALLAGKRMGFSLPDEIWVVGIETRLVFDFSETLSPEVDASVDKAAAKVIDLIGLS